MPADPDTAAGLHGSMLPAGLPATEAELRLRSSLDIAEITRLVLDATVPEFADAAAVFAAPQLIRPGEPPARFSDERTVTAHRLGTRLAHETQSARQEAFPAGEVIAFDAGSPAGEPAASWHSPAPPTPRRSATPRLPRPHGWPPAPEQASPTR
jgi:hypothetical protein